MYDVALSSLLLLDVEESDDLRGHEGYAQDGD